MGVVIDLDADQGFVYKNWKSDVLFVIKNLTKDWQTNGAQ